MPQHTQGTSTQALRRWTKQRQREIARKGGESVPAEKRSFHKIVLSLSPRKPAVKAAHHVEHE